MMGLAMTTNLAPDQREYLRIARASAEGLLSLLNEILDFSKIEAGRMELNPIVFSPKETLVEAAESIALQASQKGLVLSTHIDPAIPPYLAGDAFRLRQVLLNLLNNALKFTDTGGIRVEAWLDHLCPNETVIRFSVSDTGIGLSPEHHQTIFDKFRQADGSTTRKYGGTGLGLAICARLVQLMGGRIWVESELGKGSTFHFTVTLATESPAAADTERQDTLPVSSQPGSGLDVLVVEDNEINQRVAVRLLERWRHRVEVAWNGAEAIELLEIRSFDVVLMDIQMPKMDGIEATRRIRERESGSGGHLPIIAMTAHAMKGDRERCLAAGMDYYVSKPIDANQLMSAIEAVTQAAPIS
jgi:CheY-like chemotaxis protein